MKELSSIAITIALLASAPAIQAADDCNYASLAGKEFVFRERSESLQRYGYQDWKKEPATTGKKLDYESYVGKKGKLQEQKIEDRISAWYVAVLETCEKVYISGGLKSRPRTIADLENFTGIYYTDTLRQAESLVGKTIWVNLNSTAKDQTLFTDDPNVSYSLSHIEPLEITGLHLKSIGHGRGAGPFYLVVKKRTGEKGYIAFNDRYFFAQDLIDPKWDKAVVEMVKQRKIKIGMSEQQALLSWGKPERVNKSVGSYGVHEQWVYGRGQYVYMENGKLTSFQSSQ